MNNFAFIIHPIDPQKDVALKFPLLGRLPRSVIDYFCRFFPPIYLSHIVGVRSEATGEEIEGWLIACPLTPKQMLEGPVSVAYDKIVQTGQLAERLGARILGLGAFTSAVGDAGITISKRLSIPVTTGNSYTAAVAVEASLEAARQMNLQPRACTAAVVGAYGAVGAACTQLLARHVARLIVIGRRPERLQDLVRRLEWSGIPVEADTDIGAIRKADIVLAVTGALKPIVMAEHLKPGSVICDVAIPHSVSEQVAKQRPDVLIVKGGMVNTPGQVDYGFGFGCPPGRAYACMAETMILALEGRYENFTLGRDITLEQVDEMAQLAAKHGFRPATTVRCDRIDPERQTGGDW